MRMLLTISLAISLALGVTMVALPTQPAYAVIFPSRGYSGNVYVDGVLAPVGHKVKACIEGTFYDNDAGIVDSTGSYSLLVNGDDTETTTIKEGGVPFDLVIFWVGDKIANEFAYFASGGSETLDLYVDTSVQPAFLKINEIMPNPSSGAEWIELYNPTPNTVSLDNYAISDEDGFLADLSGGTIPAYGHFQYNYPLFPPDNLLLNGGDEVKLYWYDVTGPIAHDGNTPLPVTLDRVEYGDEGSVSADTILSNAPVPDAGESIILHSDGDDDDDPANDFIITATPSPGQSNGIPLEQGWNMFSLPILPVDSSPESVLSSLTGASSLYYYDASEQEMLARWKVYDSALPPELSCSNSLKSVEPNKAYWIYILDRQTLSVEGTVLPNNIVPLYEGYNMVSFQRYDDSVENAMRQLDFTFLYFYDAFVPESENRWKIWDNTIAPQDYYILNTLTRIRPTKGYWLHVVSDQIWEEGSVNEGEVPPPSAQVIPPSIPRSFWSGNSKLDAQPVPVGTVIDAYDPDGVLCGTSTVTCPGQFVLACLADDPNTPEDDGALPGDTITFYMNGFLATVTYGSDEWQIGSQKITIDAIGGYELTVSITGSGTVALSPDQPTYTYGTVVTITAHPDLSWSFDGWSGDLNSSNNPDTITMDGDKSITATFTTTPVNEPPEANDKSVTTDEDTIKPITLTASDPEGEPLAYAIVTAPAHGTLGGTAPSVIFVPVADYNGSDSFTFKANDGTSDSNIATVTITVVGVNDAPVANSQSVSTNENTPKSITLTATDVDGDGITYAIVDDPGYGTLSGSPPNLTYTPNTNYSGPDNFTFIANDRTLDSSPATVSITVNPVSPASYTFYGFFSPVDNTPIVNVAKAGQAIPVKWRLTDANGDPISDPTSFETLTSYGISCDSSAGEGALDEYAAGSSGLQYLGDGNWQFNWKTPRTYAGQCRMMVLILGDGNTYDAKFKFK